MKDQPKPLAPEFVKLGFKRESKPTGEWTVERLTEFADPDYSDLPRLSDAINAALRNAQPFLDSALKQLAAERKRATSFQMELAKQHTKVEQLLDQLAAAQKKLSQVQEAEARQAREIHELEQWKDSALNVMPDWQDIGNALGLNLGENVSEKILPGILDLLNQIDNQQDEITDLQHTVQYLLDIITHNKEIHTA